AIATAVSAGVVFAMPVTSQAAPMASPVQIKAVADSNVINVKHKNKSNDWWSRHCAVSNDVKCRRNYSRNYRHYRDRMYDEPYYGHYYRPYRPYRPGIYLHID